MDFEALATAFLKCSEKSSLSEKVTPNVFNEVTRGSPGTGGGMQGSTGDKRGLFTINSQDFETLSLRLLVEVHEDMESSSATTVCEWLAGTTKSTSSAYLRNRLIRLIGCRSDALTENVPGPMPEPCTIEALMKAMREIISLNFV